MIYQGPTRSDFSNVMAMNREYLRILHAGRAASEIGDAHHKRLRALGYRQRERLAAAPFLLFSLQENNGVLWRRLLRGERHPDLFHRAPPRRDELADLAATAASFLWQLAHRNPYTARLLASASPGWCDAVSDTTCFELVRQVRRCADLVVPRQAGNSGFWRKLLFAGVSAEADVRSAAHIAALQTLLTSPSTSAADTWPLAACASRRARLRVADRSDSDRKR